MDFLLIGVFLLMWGAMVLMVWGFQKLERPQRERP